MIFIRTIGILLVLFLLMWATSCSSRQGGCLTPEVLTVNAATWEKGELERMLPRFSIICSVRVAPTACPARIWKSGTNMYRLTCIRR